MSGARSVWLSSEGCRESGRSGFTAAARPVKRPAEPEGMLRYLLGGRAFRARNAVPDANRVPRTAVAAVRVRRAVLGVAGGGGRNPCRVLMVGARRRGRDRKSTRLNSSHLVISYAVFCLKK